MRRRPLQPPHGNHPNVTPLIDIVMCLIIFFMLVAKIGVSTGADASITIPASKLGKELTDPGQALTLNVRPGVGDEPMVTALVETGMKASRRNSSSIDHVTNTRPLLEVLNHPGTKTSPTSKSSSAATKKWATNTSNPSSSPALKRK